MYHSRSCPRRLRGKPLESSIIFLEFWWKFLYCWRSHASIGGVDGTCDDIGKEPKKSLRSLALRFIYNKSKSPALGLVQSKIASRYGCSSGSFGSR
ncbi:hypothetical protein Hdeb2414_s0857g00954791 [Helianthus debilis subsp. tardiflorus]